MHGQFTGTPLVDEDAGRPAHKRRKLATRRPVGNIQRLVDDFSHDIRTPLTVINEYVSLLANGPDGSNDVEQRQIFDVIADRVDDLNHAFNDFLDAIKLEAGALGVCRRKCRVVDLVAHIRPGLARKAAVRHCQFQFDVPADLPGVFCDTEQIGRVLINLATHAIKSCPQQGTVRLWATCGEQQNEVIFGVADDGQRIPSAERTTNRQRLPRGKGGSIGVGKDFGRKLRIARDLVQLNLAEIQSETTEAGTIFWFSLPVADPTEIASRYLRQRFGRPSDESTVSFAKVWGAGKIEGNRDRDASSLLGMLLRPTDLIFQVEHGLWLIALARKHPDLPGFLRRVEVMRETVNRRRLREPLPAFVAEPLGTWRPPDDVGPLLETIRISFDVKTATQKENPT